MENRQPLNFPKTRSRPQTRFTSVAVMRPEFWPRWHHESRCQLRRIQSAEAVKRGAADSGTCPEFVAGQSGAGGCVAGTNQVSRARQSARCTMSSSTILRLSRVTNRHTKVEEQQAVREHSIRQHAMHTARETVATGLAPKPSSELQQQHRRALKRYWSARLQLNTRLRAENTTLWRRLMPYDPVITVAEDVVFFECFSADESSYGCLTLDRDQCFSNAQNACVGTTNIDYSWDLYHNFQSLRSYRETQFTINPEKASRS